MWVYNTRGELTSETQPESGTTSYVYDNAGLLTQSTNALNKVTTFTYDQNDRLKTRTLAGGDSSSNLSITYGTGATLGAQTTHAITIQGSDSPPNVNISVLDTAGVKRGTGALQADPDRDDGVSGPGPAHHRGEYGDARIGLPRLPTDGPDRSDDPHP